VTRRLEVAFPSREPVSKHVAKLDVVVVAGGEWRTSLEFRLGVDGEKVELRYSGDDPDGQSAPVTRLRAWEETALASGPTTTPRRDLSPERKGTSGRCRSSIRRTPIGR
jgi:hypothetical protein